MPVNPATAKRRWLWAFALAPVVALTAWLVGRPESYDHADAKLLEYAMNGDGAGMLSYMDPDEVRLTGASAPAMSELLNRYVRVRLAGMDPAGEPRFEEYEHAVGYVHIFHSPDGRRAFLSFQLQRNGRRVIAAPLISGLVISPMTADLPGNLPTPHGANMVAFRLGELDRYVRVLKETGLVGIVTGQPLDFTAVRWDTFHREFAVRLAKAQESEALIGPNAPRSYRSTANLVP